MAVYCKSCGKRCIVMKSKSEVNPDRSYWSCPTQWVDGGHGWVDWVDGPRSAKRLTTSRSPMRDLDMDTRLMKYQGQPSYGGEQLRQSDSDRILDDLVKALDKEKMKTNCLMKVLAGVVVCFMCWIVFN